MWDAEHVSLVMDKMDHRRLSREDAVSDLILCGLENGACGVVRLRRGRGWLARRACESVLGAIGSGVSIR